MPTALEIPDRRGRRALLTALAAAFLDNPMNRRLHGPDPGRRLRANRAGLAALVLDLHPWTETRVVRHAGRVVGGFVAVPPGAFPLPGASLARQLACLFFQGARAMEGWGFVTDALRCDHPIEPHWYLSVLGVAPEARGRGLGGRLLDGLFALGAGSPHAIHLETDRAESAAFYRARGFAVKSELELLGVRCWRMGREPALRSSGEGTDLCHAVARRSALEPNPPDVEAREAARTEVAP